MLIAMLTVFLLGGGLLGGSMLTPADVDLIGERTEQVVNDPARASTAARVLGELKSEVEAFNEVFVTSSDELRDLYLDHEADSRQSLEKLDALNFEWQASQNRGIELREQLRDVLTAQEWAAVFNRQE